MKGHVRKRGNKWCFVIDIGRDENGKRRQKWFSGFDSKREAERAMIKKIAELNMGQYIEPTKMTVRELFQTWLEDHVKMNNAPTTYEKYKLLYCIHIDPRIGQMELTRLYPVNLTRIYKQMKERGLSDSMVHQTHATIKTCFNWGERMGLVERNPIKKVPPPRKTKKVVAVWTDEELFQFLKSTRGKRYFPLYYLAAFTGMRKGELLALRWEDIDFDKKLIRITRNLIRSGDTLEIRDQPKTSRSRRAVHVSDSTILVLKEHRKAQLKEMMEKGYRNQHNLVFTNLSGGLVHPANINRVFAVDTKKAGVKRIRFHDLRHTHASMLLRRGVHPKVVSERLGHSSVTITLDTYSHLVPSLQEDAAKVTEDPVFHGLFLGAED